MIMSTYLAAFVVGPLEVTEPVDVGGIPLPRRARAGQGPPHRVRARRRRVQPALVPGLLRNPVPQRQGRPAGAARLRGRGDGEPRLHHVPREPVARRSGDRRHSTSRKSSPMSSLTSSPTCGSATSSRWAGGTASGSTRRSPRSWRSLACDAYRPDWERWTTFGLERSVGIRDRFAGEYPFGRVRGEVAGRLRGHVRRAHVPEGRRAAAHARAVPGSRTFPRGGQPLPRTHAYSNTDTSDLWDAIEVTSGEPVRRIDGLVDLAARLPADHRRPSTAISSCCASHRSASTSKSDVSHALDCADHGTQRRPCRHTAPRRARSTPHAR